MKSAIEKMDEPARRAEFIIKEYNELKKPYAEITEQIERLIKEGSEVEKSSFIYPEVIKGYTDEFSMIIDTKRNF